MTTPEHGRLAGKVALITGAARGQGRSHAVTLAEHGADVVLVDAVRPIDGVGYPLPSSSELKAAAQAVEALGRRAVVVEADVRDEELAPAVDDAVERLGGLDVVVANAGVLGSPKPSWELTRDEWSTVIDINLSGVWQTTKATVPHLIAGGRGGSVIAISSIAGLRGIPNVAQYCAAKHGVVGLATALANEVAEHGIRVNTIHPTNVRTPMIDNPVSAKIFRPDLDQPTLDDGADVLRRINMLPQPWVEMNDVSQAVLWLASDESRYITGTALPVDAGMLSKYAG
ncbi:mycofactocin-coupled SDR family oxidoreductase [Saccharopolyspora sp. TS4A08]|uniref:Mycofactocin-coupled SDR family oxidoreductase n=1 Tax=Saccharopolyspora ipomoeae TaxID=3042027 RepID=A0ABT6PQ92_9PSEU|nr:mycofactocin-coupled SDR family oxidoreductase [Saccharopolyspora sp. TS4A08]MDI2030179.1 mycofactocin-coupled SDR family oxidoreductase [Saccharopolyspora sp. TS4A08]